jgi:hypothetical protein
LATVAAAAVSVSMVWSCSDVRLHKFSS